MHLEKGVFKSTIDLLLDIPGKTKYGLSIHKDLQTLKTREELHPQERPNGKAYLPQPSYTVTIEEKMSICKGLHGIRIPTGFSTNIKNLVSMSELKMSGYNTHDCHTMLSLFFCHCNQSSQSSKFEDGDHTHVPFLQCYIKKGNRR
jgi:hypothetical protein